MASERSFDVSTKVLIDQTRLTLSELKAPANKKGQDALQSVGCDVPSFITDLDTSVKRLREVESKQERLKVLYLRETKDDRDISERGYRWILRLHSRIRLYLAENAQADEYDLRTRFRFGKIRMPRARTVVYELRILLPELHSMETELSGVGVTPKFIREGEEILSTLVTEREETAEAKAEREKFTRKVRKFEIQVSRLLRRLELSDEAAALEHAEGKRWFPLDIILTEQGRVKAAREARVTALPEDALSSDEIDI
jgi:hypothetical protein